MPHYDQGLANDIVMSYAHGYAPSLMQAGDWWKWEPDWWETVGHRHLKMVLDEEDEGLTDEEKRKVNTLLSYLSIKGPRGDHSGPRITDVQRRLRNDDPGDEVAGVR